MFWKFWEISSNTSVMEFFFKLHVFKSQPAALSNFKIPEIASAVEFSITRAGGGRSSVK